MSPSSCACGAVRPAAVVNEEIRALADGGPWDEDRYGQLLEEWAEVSRIDHGEAA